MVRRRYQDARCANSEGLPGLRDWPSPGARKYLWLVARLHREGDAEDTSGRTEGASDMTARTESGGEGLAPSLVQLLRAGVEEAVSNEHDTSWPPSIYTARRPGDAARR